MSEVEAMYDDAEQAQRAIEVLRRDDDVEEVRYVEAPATQHLPLAETKARRGVALGAGVGMVLGLIAAALITWRVGDIVTGSAVWVLGLGTMLLGALAGGLAFALDRLSAQPAASSGTIWLRTSTQRIGRLVTRLHRLGARRVEVLDASELPELAPLRR
jgi:Mg/Co/Ni transporter MgtE